MAFLITPSLLRRYTSLQSVISCNQSKATITVNTMDITLRILIFRTYQDSEEDNKYLPI